MNPLPQRTSSAAWVRGIAELFAAEGLPVQALCAQADIDLESLQHPHTRVDVDRVSRLWEAAAQHYDRPGLGLDRQLAARYGSWTWSATHWPRGPTFSKASGTWTGTWR